MYITLDKYTALYDPVEEKVFNRIAYDACRYIDEYTTGIDGVKKLKEAFPVDEDAVEAVSRCAAAVANFLIQIDAAERSAFAARGYSETANGYQGKVVSSVSAGNESISFSSGDMKTAVDAALSDQTERNKTVYNIVHNYLSGVSDANGVNLLYLGRYPV